MLGSERKIFSISCQKGYLLEEKPLNPFHLAGFDPDTVQLVLAEGRGKAPKVTLSYTVSRDWAKSSN